VNEGGVQLVRELTDALNADDRSRLDSMLADDVVQYGTRGGIDQDRVIRGREEVTRYWDEISEVWGSLRYETERLIDAGDRAVVFWRETARIRDTDVEVQSNTATIFTFREGRIVEVQGYLDRDEALRDAGVEE
jgi:ketosteroid isomerase-like protein